MVICTYSRVISYQIDKEGVKTLSSGGTKKKEQLKVHPCTYGRPPGLLFALVHRMQHGESNLPANNEGSKELSRREGVSLVLSLRRAHPRSADAGKVQDTAT